MSTTQAAQAAQGRSATLTPKSKPVDVFRARPTPFPSLSTLKRVQEERAQAEAVAWQRKAAERKAQLEAEEREWFALLANAKAALAAGEEAEWRTLRERALGTGVDEESEWQAQRARADALTSTRRAA